MDKDGRELLVAVSFGLSASEAVADRRSSSQIKRWEAYARLYKKVKLLCYGHGLVNFHNIQDRYFKILSIF